MVAGCRNPKTSQSHVNKQLINMQNQIPTTNLNSASRITQNENQSIKQTQNAKHTLIVFVHGTILPLPSPSCVFSSFNKKHNEKKSWTGRYYEKLRYKTFFKCQPIANLGLENISFLSASDAEKYPYTKLSADLYGNCYSFANPESLSNLHFYTFGWDGRLSQESRLNSAKILYSSLLKEISRIKNSLDLKDQDLELILIGHSHGGNILLNLAKVKTEFKNNLVIDKLIMLGTPVQSETKELISDPMFKKVYSFYSNGDIIQVMDIVSTEDATSKRRYKNSNTTQKLVQIELKIGKKEPRHTELWLFGDSSNMLYRKHLAIYPLPAFVFVLVIIRQLDSKYPNAREMLALIDKDKKNKTFTIKLTDKTQNQVSFLTSIPAQILEYKKTNLDK
jgi:hypothetical protein